MNFEPKTEEQIAESKLFKAGVYPFEILEAKETTSKSGNPMIELRVKVINNGSSRVVTDYLLPQRAEKLLHCCVVCGCQENYERGELSGDDFLGKTGKLKLVVERGRKDETGTKWPDKNVIEDYVAA